MCDFPPIKPLLLTRAHLHTHTHTYPAAVTYRLTVTITQAQTPLSLSTAATEISHSPRASFTSTSPVPPASSSRASDQTRPVTTCPAALRSLAPRATFVIVNHAGASLSLFHLLLLPPLESSCYNCCYTQRGKSTQGRERVFRSSSPSAREAD